MSVKIYSREIARQVGLYSRPNGLPGGHFNPVSGGWNSAKDDLNYYFSSARFYETGIDEFGSLNNLYGYLLRNKNFIRVPRTKAKVIQETGTYSTGNIVEINLNIFKYL